MTIHLEAHREGRLLEIHLSDTLLHEDYKQWLPVLEEYIDRHGTVRLLVFLRNFSGWDVAALWDDIKFEFTHYSNIEQIALIGESRWQEGMAMFCKPFTAAKVKYFDESKVNEAVRWINDHPETEARPV